MDIVVTGLGLTTALGRGADACWAALRAGQSGIRPLRTIDTEGYPIRDGGEAPDLPAGSLPAGADNRDRALAHTRAAIAEALEAAGLAGGRVPDPERAALIVGSSLAASASSPAFWAGFLEGGPEAADYRALRCWDVEPALAELARTFDVRGETLLVSNACAAGVSAIALAADALRAGRADLVVAAGFDAIDVHTFAGFGALGAQDAEAMKPFSVGRAGMKLGDGFAALVLETAEAARVAGRRPLARLLGHGESADAHHLTQPDPEGRGAALAMRRALEDAGLSPEAIDYVNLHATATPANDLAEARAMRAVLGERLDEVPLQACKPVVGHALGGAGTVEAAIALLVLRHGFVPRTPGVTELEPEIGAVQLGGPGRDAAIRCVMSNSFGFGGCNASVIFGEAAS